MIDKKYEKRYTMYIEIKWINVKKYHVNPRRGGLCAAEIFVSYDTKRRCANCRYTPYLPTIRRW